MAEPLFPPVCTMIMKPSDWYSKGKTATLVSGGAMDLTNYPLSALTDGSAGEGSFRFIAKSGSVRINLNSGNTKTPNIFGIFGHNFDPYLIVSVSASINGGVSQLYTRGFSARSPAFWIDLRGFPQTADYWTLSFSQNSKPVIIGEIVIGYGSIITGSLEPYEESINTYLERDYLEYGETVEEGSGILYRKLGLRFQLSMADRAIIDAVYSEAGINGSRVIVVPNSRQNKIFLIDWPAAREYTFPQSFLKAPMSLDLEEEVFGTY